MTIKTLEYIHSLLQKEKQMTRENLEEARMLARKYENSETPDRELIKKQNDSMRGLYDEHSAAADALRDFEQVYWR